MWFFFRRREMKISDDIIRSITLTAIKELGEVASHGLVKKVVNNAVGKLNNISHSDSNFAKSKTNEDSGKVILTSFGYNRAGVVFEITKILAEYKCDIQDMTQKILQDYFTMIMIIDLTESNIKFNDLKEKFLKLAENLGIKIFLQHEDVFNFMHRI
jgi:ACT domain-containing protein